MNKRRLYLFPERIQLLTQIIARGRWAGFQRLHEEVVALCTLNIERHIYFDAKQYSRPLSRILGTTLCA